MATRDPNREPRDLMDSALCVCASLRKTARAVTQHFDAALKPAGLTPNQFTLLAALAKRGETAQAELAKALVMDRTTLIRNLKPLVGRGLIGTATASGRGVKTLSLSTAGARALEAALPAWRTAQRQLAQTLGQQRARGLIADLQSTVAAVQPE